MNTPGRTTRILLILLAALAVLAGGIYYAWRTGFVQTAPPEKFLTAVVAHGKFEDTVKASGILQPREFVDVGTQVSGQVLSLQAGIGDLVQAGQLLAEIDPSVFQARVDGDRAQLLNHWAQLADKKAQLVLADLQLVREQNLARDNATTAEALQSAEALRKSAEAQVNSVGAQIQQTKSGLRGSEASLGYTRRCGAPAKRSRPVPPPCAAWQAGRQQYERVRAALVRPSSHDEFGYGGEHLRRLKGFDDPSLGAAFLAGFLFLVARFGRQHDDRGELVGGVLFHFPQESQTIHVGHIDIRNDEMNLLPRAFGQRVLTIAGFDDGIARPSEGEIDDLPERGRVIDYQYGLAHECFSLKE